MQKDTTFCKHMKSNNVDIRIITDIFHIKILNDVWTICQSTVLQKSDHVKKGCPIPQAFHLLKNAVNKNINCQQICLIDVEFLNQPHHIGLGDIAKSFSHHGH